AQRAARERRVLRVGEDGPAVHAPGRADDAVAGARLGAHPARVDLGADDVERPGVAQRLQALQRPQGDGGLVGDDRAHSATPLRQRTALWPPNPNEFEIAMAGPPSTSRRRGPSGT